MHDKANFALLCTFSAVSNFMHMYISMQCAQNTTKCRNLHLNNFIVTLEEKKPYFIFSAYQWLFSCNISMNS